MAPSCDASYFDIQDGGLPGVNEMQICRIGRPRNDKSHLLQAGSFRVRKEIGYAA